jgi:hypothetical protein
MEDANDVPNVTFIDVLQAMIRERFKTDYLKERGLRLLNYKKMTALYESGQLDEEDQLFLKKNIERWDAEKELNLEFSEFMKATDFDDKDVEVLNNLKRGAAHASK